MPVVFAAAMLSRNTDSAGHVSLNWTGVDGADGYIVYRGTSLKALKEISTTSGTGYTDQTVSAQDTYYYTVVPYWMEGDERVAGKYAEYLLSGPSPFADVQDTTAYYYKPVLWAVEKSITSGTSKTTFSPNETCTRGQVVTFLYRNAN